MRARSVFDQLAGDPARVAAAHPLEHRIGDVLERHVDVLHDLGLARDRVDQLVVERARERVVEPDPVDAFGLAELAQQLGEGLARPGRAARVPAVAREVLRDQVDLAHAARAERADLGGDVRDRAAALRAAQLGDDAERARPVAALGDLDVRRVGGPDADARRLVIVDVRGGLGDLHHRQRLALAAGLALGRARARRAAEQLRDRLEVRRAEDVIDLGDVLDEIAGVALREAAGDHELGGAGLLVLGHLEDGVDALFLGGIDERAGVDDDHVGTLGVVDQRVTRGLDLAEHQLGVDLVLGATEGHEVDALRSGNHERGAV